MKKITINLSDSVYDAHQKLYQQALADMNMSEKEHSFKQHLAISLSHTTNENSGIFDDDLVKIYSLLEASLEELLAKKLDGILFKALMRYLHIQGVNKK